VAIEKENQVKKKLKLSQEIKDIWGEWQAYITLRNKYVDKYFGFKKAVKCAKKAEKIRDIFWYKIHLLYPNFDSNLYEYSFSKNALVLIKRDD